MCANYSLYTLSDILIDIKKPAKNLTGLCMCIMIIYSYLNAYT